MNDEGDESIAIVDPFEFPTPADCRRLHAASSLGELFNLVESCRAAHSGFATDLRSFRRVVEPVYLLHEVKQRFADVGRSYVLMMFY